MACQGCGCEACECDDYEDFDDSFCPECHGEGTGMSDCIDDLCNGGEVPCMHGNWDAYRCQTCGA